jgi:hypothetical protein
LGLAGFAFISGRVHFVRILLVLFAAGNGFDLAIHDISKHAAEFVDLEFK